jgi:hypothetical protein
MHSLSAERPVGQSTVETRLGLRNVSMFTEPPHHRLFARPRTPHRQRDDVLRAVAVVGLARFVEARLGLIRGPARNVLVQNNTCT